LYCTIQFFDPLSRSRMQAGHGLIPFNVFGLTSRELQLGDIGLSELHWISPLWEEPGKIRTVFPCTEGLAEHAEAWEQILI
jgi:hypothetical protein